MFQNPRGINHIDLCRDHSYYRSEFLISEKAHKKIFEEKFNEFLNHLNPGKILDIGCATGTFLNVAKIRGWEVTGIDVSEWACNYLKQNGFQNIFCTDIENVDFKDDYFDVININHTLEHVLDPIKTLKCINRVLKPGGLLLIEVPNEKLFPFNYKIINMFLPTHISKRHTSHSHFCLFTPKSLKHALKLAEFNIQIFREEGFFSNSRTQTNVFKKKSFLMQFALMFCKLKFDVFFQMSRYIVAVAQKKSQG
ncbi:hypothetical protein JCM12294_32230 [Desulfocicer niacini]